MTDTASHSGPLPLEGLLQALRTGDPALFALLGGAALVLLLLVVWLVVRARKEARRFSTKAVPPLPPPAPPPVDLPPSPAEAESRARVEQARAEAERLKAERRALEERARGQADGAHRDALAREALRLKEEEEARKREEYRAKKELEREERDRHRREQEERTRLDEAAKARAAAEEAERARQAAEEERQRIAAQAGQTLAQGLAKTRSQGFMAQLNGMFGQPKVVDESVLAQLEEVLFGADIGVKTASRLVELSREKMKRKELSSAERIKEVIRSQVEEIVDLPIPPRLEGGGPPHVVMVVGVNGSGKTTTIGKLAAKLTAQGKRVLLAAGDTFRAAAAEQLDVWAERAGAELVKGKENADPASVVFEAVKKGQEGGYDVVIADTAGRLHTQAPLMEELKKVKRVIGKALPGAPHEVLLVLDATTGQNAIVQAKQFQEAVGVTAIALTKLDGTAKGGVVIGICDELKTPVAWVGVGEKVADLRPFSPREFVSALFDA